MTVRDFFGQLVGVETVTKPKVHTTSTGQTKGDVLSDAAKHLKIAGEDVLTSAKLTAEDLGQQGWEQMGVFKDYSAQKASEAAHIAAEQAKRGAHYAGELLSEGADFAMKKASEGAHVGGKFVEQKGAEAWQASKEAAEVSGQYLKEKSAEALDASQEQAAKLADWSAKEAQEQFENLQKASARAMQYSKEQAAKGLEATVDQSSQLYQSALAFAKQQGRDIVSYVEDGAGNVIETTKDAAGVVREKVSDASGQSYERIVQMAQSGADNAEDLYEYYRDAAGREMRRLVRKAGDKADDAYDASADAANKAYRKSAQVADDANHEAHGMFHHVTEGISHLGHNIGSLFHRSTEEAEEVAEDAYDKARRGSQHMAESGRHYANQAAEEAKSGYAYVKNKAGEWVLDAQDAADDATSSSYFNSKEWQKYFSKNNKLDAAWWKQYIRQSGVNPAHWREMIDAYQSGPSDVQKFWRRAEKKGYQAKDRVQSSFSYAKASAQRTLGPSEGVPVSLFWTAVLALYLLVLAKRIFEQRRDAQINDGRDVTPSEKVKLTHAAKASSDSLATFAIYAPATAVVLLAHELQNAASPLVLHTLYGALFAGQVLQNETSLVTDAKTRGVGVYLSWGAAGLAGMAGILSSISGFHL